MRQPRYPLILHEALATLLVVLLLPSQLLLLIEAGIAAIWFSGNNFNLLID
ncbi:hypothetical protein QN348_00250 [Mucilaginibacter sp. 5C4]|nr:hypothetical protein [Mucilaginibacter sp. 5B2]MEB0263393.1 hypothetical protein [Mucilaginibacter sp. 10I4]MEB0299288.1 hypothetical protein [Mucilaginibacter sp. 5C4]